MNIKKERPAKQQATATAPSVGKTSALSSTLNATTTGNKSQGQKAKQAQKQQHPSKPAASQSDDVSRQQKLQAILLADSFSKSFRPITLEGPKVLLPLVNVPMIEYTIEFLAQNGVEEVFIFCVWHADMIEQYVKASKWATRLAVRCISSPNCQSAGDALRELDALNVIRSDPFVLISGDVISNINLKDAISFHKLKRKSDSNNVMTVVLKKVQPLAGAKPLLDDLTVAMNRESSQIVLFENSFKRRSVSVCMELLSEHRPAGLRFHTDLLDCHVDICSPELMLQFSDNFDYQDIRRDFIQNEVGNYSLGKHIFGYLIQNEYAARVQDFRSYHSICRDIVTRWVFPLVPDAQLLHDSTYVHTKRNSYREGGVQVARSAMIGEGVVLGRGSVVGEQSVLKRVIVGRDCMVGSGASINESHIWSGAVIGNNVTITHSIICDKVIIADGVSIPRGCILSYGVRIGSGAQIPEFARISTTSSGNSELLGQDSLGGLWVDALMDEFELGDDEGDGPADEVGHPVQVIDYSRMRSIGCREEEQWKKALWKDVPLPSEEYDSDADEGSQQSDEDGFTGDVEGSSARANLQFSRAVGDMVTAGRSDKAENVLVDIKGFRFAQNKSCSDCIQGIVPALVALLLPAQAVAGRSKSTVFITSLKDLLKHGGWGYMLVQPLLLDAKDEVQVILSLEEAVLRSDEHSLFLQPLFGFMLQIAYDEELISEEAVLRWIAMREGVDDYDHDLPSGLLGAVSAEDKQRLFADPAVQKFVEWIQTEEEDDDDDEEDDDEEDDDGDEEDDDGDKEDDDGDYDDAC